MVSLWLVGGLASEGKDPAWLELPQVYVVISKSAKVPTYRLLPQNPKESLWIVYEVRLQTRASTKIFGCKLEEP